MQFKKQEEYTKKATDLGDVPSQNMPPSEIKQYFQTSADEIRDTFNTLVDGLNSSGWVDFDKIAPKGIKRSNIAPGSVGTQEIDPAIMSQPNTLIGAQAQLQQVNEQLAETTDDINTREINMLFPPAPLVGVKGDGITDDSNAINNILSGYTTKVKFKFPAGKTYKVTKSLLIDVSKYTIEANGAILDASGLVDASLLNFTCSESTPYNNASNPIEGFTIKGPGKTSSATLFNLDSTNIPTTSDISHILFKNIVAYGFGIGIFFGQNAYIETFEHCSFYSMGTIIKAPSGYSNSGERNTFINCCLFNSNLVLDADNGGDFYFNSGCSFDYCTLFMNIGSTRVFIDHCHLEYGHGESTAQNMVTITKGGSVLSIKDSYIIGANDIVSTLEFINVADASMVNLSNISISNISGNRLVKANGNARVNIKNIHGDAFNKHYLPSEQLTFLSDPTFEKSYALSQLTVNVAGSSSITLDSSVYSSGTHSIKMAKPNTTQTELCNFNVTVPMTMGQKLYFDFLAQYDIAKGGLSFDQVRIWVDYMDSLGNILQTYEEFFSGLQSSFARKYSQVIQNSAPPKGTAKARINIGINREATGTLYLDDFYINVC